MYKESARGCLRRHCIASSAYTFTRTLANPRTFVDLAGSHITVCTEVHTSMTKMLLTLTMGTLETSPSIPVVASFSHTAAWHAGKSPRGGGQGGPGRAGQVGGHPIGRGHARRVPGGHGLPAGHQRANQERRRPHHGVLVCCVPWRHGQAASCTSFLASRLLFSKRRMLSDNKRRSTAMLREVQLGGE